MTPRRGHGAIERIEDDRLNRELLAYDLAVRLDSPPAEEGYVLGLTGPWGSGKSSLMNLVALHVAEKDIIVRFNPWLYSDTNELVTRFLTDVRKALPRWRNWRVRGAIARYAGALVPLGRLGFLTPGMPIAAAVGGAVVRLFGGARTPEQEREVVRAALLRLKDRRLIVLVDDMDRLAPPEVVEMVRLMKLVGDFPRTSYLVAYDRSHVEHALKTVHGEELSGRAYLEKIVQSTQLVPHIEGRTLAALLVEELEAAAAAERLPGKLMEAPRWAAIQRDVVMPLVGTVRDIRRYVEVASAGLRVNGGEVDSADVLGLEAVRLFAPDVHDAIAPNAVLLTRRSSSFPLFGQEVRPEKEQLDKWLAAVDTAHQPLAKTVLRHFFPTAYGHLNGEMLTNDHQDDWVRTRRVATLTGLLTYLTNAVGEDVVDSELTEQALQALVDPDKFRSIVESMSEPKLRDLMGRLNATEIAFDPTTAAGTVAVLFSLVRKFHLETRTMFQPAVETYVAPLAERLLTSVPRGDRDRAAEQVFAAIHHPYDRFQFLRYFGTFPSEQGADADNKDRRPVESNGSGPGPRYVSEAVSTQLRNAVHAQVVAASADEFMEWGRPNDVLTILFDGDREEGTARLAQLFESDDFALYILVAHAQRELDQSHEPPRSVVSLSYDAIASMVGPDLLGTIVERLRQNRPDKTLNPDEASVLGIAIRYARGERPTDD